MRSEIRSRFAPTLILLGIISLVGVLLADLAAPLGNGAAWFAFVAALLFIALVSFYIAAKDWLISKLPIPTLLNVLFFVSGAALIFTVFGIVAAAGPTTGYLARWMTPLAELQTRWLPVAALPAPEETPILAESSPITSTVPSATVGELQAEFVALQSTITPVADPQTPLAWYHNARAYAQNGDIDAAQAAYTSYFTHALDFVDPYLDYTNFLTTALNPDSAVQQLAELTNSQANRRAATLAATTFIQDPQERLAKLSEFAAEQSDYGPAWYELARNYVQALQVSYTQRQFQRLQTAFEQLQTLVTTDNYTRYYLDQARAQAQLDELALAVAKFETLAETLQLVFLPYFSAREVNIAVVLPDTPIQELRYNIDDPTPITPTGMITVAGQLRVNTTIGPLPLEPGPHTLYVDYIDRAGEVSPVYSYDYTIQPIAVNLVSQRFGETLNGVPSQVTLAVIGSDPQALYTYRYSIDSATLEQSQQGLGGGTVIRLPPLTTGEHTLYLQAEGEGGSTPLIAHRFRLE